MKQGNTLSPSSLSRRGLTGCRRFDIPTSDLPYRKSAPTMTSDVPDTAPRTRYATITEWCGRAAAVIAVVLFAMVLLTIHKGLLVQDSARTVVDNFRVTNEFFAQRADLTAPATARRQLDELNGVLAQLNSAAATDVDHLAALLPNAQALVAAGQGDTQIAGELESVATTLQGSAASLHQISADANTTVTAVNDELTRALDLTNQLNAELTRTTNKLALVPASDALIPAPEGIR
ncbi:hypothetical protein [Rhodococcus sp. NCIMB 12038]|uniref:hypothetical protein n=1 Tax=Rhodococcus sp. NCIMB 12038 TaxID=933800 RepID=UPI000B3C783E|nr:hypothetical protein [Rhodococcus sp. NCIMB 12038]OUS81343.1 hypothetical protein CA951_41550 [Rhodococcus sp. NCIMB 12038]